MADKRRLAGKYVVRLISFEGGFGRVMDDLVVPMGTDLVEYLESGEASDHPVVPTTDVAITAPIRSPGKIVCVGLNYQSHADEVGSTVPSSPTFFAKFANSVAGPEETVFVPDSARDLDYEAELGVVMGRTAREVRREEALEYVAGYVCVNDLSSRSLQFRTSQWTMGKAVDGFLPMGPYLVTADEIPDPQHLAITCEVDGELRQSASTADMIFPVDALIEIISQTITLEPGDLIATGTPSGVGMSLTPPRYLVPGSEVVVEIERLGRLVTHVAPRITQGGLLPQEAFAGEMSSSTEAISSGRT